MKLARLLSTQPWPPDIGPALWEAFDRKFASTRLTEWQRRFVVEYIKVPSGASAARAAGYSPRRGRQQAYDNLCKPKIRRLVRLALYLRRRDWNVRMGFIPPDAKIPRL